MEQEEKTTRASKRKREAFKNRVLKTFVITGILLAVIVILWLILEPFLRNSYGDQEENGTAEAVILQEPENADGSGAPGRAALAEGMTVKYATPGWQKNENGWWYAEDEATYLYNGWLTVDDQQYHLDGNGYMDTGWTAIANSGCYFDDQGVYHPEMTSDKMVALTFDDGPSEYTPALLDILESTGAKATFLMLGAQVEKYGAECIPRMMQLGCTLGNHSYNHNYLMDSDIATVQNEFATTDAVIAQYNGTGSQVIRFPYGDYTKEQEAAVGKPALFWDLDSLDWDSQNADTICQTIYSQIETGNIILMHDVYSSTIEACRTLIPQLMAEGYQFVTIEELAAARGYDLKPGVTYYGFTDAQIAAGAVTDENRETVE